MILNGYKLIGELQNANSGFSKWGFAEKNGKEYFVKELIKPVFPMDRSIMSDALFEQRRNSCYQFENRLREMFERINSASHGNLVRVVEFFRLDSKYYIITEKVKGTSLPMEKIATISLQKKLLLFKAAARSFYDLHNSGVVHFDVKPANLLLKITHGDNFVTRVIDFDSGFMKGEVLDNDELGGDLTYLAPETFLAMCGENVTPDEKADIFALGLIFHEYYCGKLPYYDESEYGYPYEAALDEGKLKIEDSRMPEAIFKLISSMLDVNPEKRPSAAEIINLLNNMTNTDKDSLDINYLEINYSCFIKSAMRKRKIVLKKEGIFYENLRCAATLGFPEAFFAKQERIFEVSADGNSGMFDEISKRLNDSGLFNILTCGGDSIYSPGHAEIDGIECSCSNGMSYSFTCKGGYTNEFIKIIEILASYCNFPQHDGPVASPPITPTASAPKTGGDWFSQAGDL